MFYGLVDFNHGTGVYELETSSYIAYLLKLNKCDYTFGATAQTACLEYNFNGNILSNSGIFVDTILSYYGCDSIFTLDLTIISVNDSVIQNGNILTAQASGALYQWIECGNGNTILPGETNQTFTTTIDGEYAVIVSENGCSDTSSCFTISNIGFAFYENENELSVLNNPAHEQLTISLESNNENIDVLIYNELGALVRYLPAKANNKQIVLDIEDLRQGVYYLKVSSENDCDRTCKFVKL